MAFWDKVKDAAQKAAEAAKDQVQREDSFLNKTVDATKNAADKAKAVAKDQVNRQDSVLNKAKASVAAKTDGILGEIDSMDAGVRDDKLADAKRYVARKKAETLAGLEEPPPEARDPDEIEQRFHNSEKWNDEQVYKRVAETIYPDFRSLPIGEKKGALCEIARYDKKIVDMMRAIGSAYIDTIRQLVESNDGLEGGYRAVLEASGLASDRDLEMSYKAWLSDGFGDDFYADDDGGHTKSTRLLGWLVFSRAGAARGQEGGRLLKRAFEDAGVRDVYGLARKVARARALIDAREEVVEKHFRPRRASFTSQFLVQKGINADVHFAWLEPDGSVSRADDGDDDDEGNADSGSGDSGESPFEL